MELFKQYEGFNTDIIRPGAVLFMRVMYTEYTAGLGDKERVIEGNVIIVHSSPTTFAFKDIRSFRDNTLVEINYYDVKSEAVKLHVIRELK